MHTARPSNTSRYPTSGVVLHDTVDAMFDDDSDIEYRSTTSKSSFEISLTNEEVIEDNELHSTGPCKTVRMTLEGNPSIHSTRDTTVSRSTGVQINVQPAVSSTRNISVSPESDISSEEPFHLEFYMTNPSAYITEMLVQSRKYHRSKLLNIGRPNLPEIFQRVANVAADLKEGKRRVCIMVCGPPVMMNEALNLCSQVHRGVRGDGLIGNQVIFDLHNEEFNI